MKPICDALLVAKVVRGYSYVCGSNTKPVTTVIALERLWHRTQERIQSSRATFQAAKIECLRFVRQGFQPKDRVIQPFQWNKSYCQRIDCSCCCGSSKGFPMEFRIAELRKSAVNNRKSSFKDDRNRDWLSSGNVEELKKPLNFKRTLPLVLA